MLQHKELRFNSTTDPLSQFVVHDQDEVIVAPGVPDESAMRREALKYVGREAVIGAQRMGKAAGDYLFSLIVPKE